jgi:hypothetical protein
MGAEDVRTPRARRKRSRPKIRNNISQAEDIMSDIKAPWMLVAQALKGEAEIGAQNRIIGPVLASTSRPKPPAAVKLLNWFPALRRLPARLIGIGARPEHIRTPEIISGTKNPST